MRVSGAISKNQTNQLRAEIHIKERERLHREESMDETLLEKSSALNIFRRTYKLSKWKYLKRKNVKNQNFCLNYIDTAYQIYQDYFY